MMKMTNILISMAGATALMLAACSSGSMVKNFVDGYVDGKGSVSNGSEADATVKKVVDIPDFDGIDAEQGIKIVYSQGASSGKADIATTPSAEKYLRVTVKDRTLHAYYEGDYGDKIKGPSIIRVTGASLKDVELSSAAVLEIKTDLKVESELVIDISSAASFIAGNVRCGKLKIEASSASSAKIGNLTGYASLDASSSANVWIGALQGEIVNVEASSVSEVTVKSLNCKRLRAEASSAAKIILSGKTQSFSKVVSSGAGIDDSSLQVDK